MKKDRHTFAESALKLCWTLKGWPRDQYNHPIDLAVLCGIIKNSTESSESISARGKTRNEMKAI